MLYYGNNATKDSDKNSGIALGLGYEYTWAALPYHSPCIAIEYSFSDTSYYEEFANTSEPYLLDALTFRCISFTASTLINR